MSNRNLVIIVTLTCLATSVYLAIAGKDGWGWFLFVAAVTADIVKKFMSP